MKVYIVMLLLFTLLIAACISEKNSNNKELEVKIDWNKAYIEKKYTCEGEDIPPNIEVKNIPKEVESLAIIMHDPDAPNGDFIHLFVYNIRVLNSTLEIEDSLPSNSVIAKNDFGRFSYNGPCPPKGSRHKYVIDVYGLSEYISPDSKSRDEILEEIKNKHVAYGFDYGYFKRN